MQFRAYFVDQHKHIRGAVDIDALGLPEARAKAVRLTGEFGVELWQLDQYVCQFDRTPPSAASGPSDEVGARPASRLPANHTASSKAGEHAA